MKKNLLLIILSTIILISCQKSDEDLITPKECYVQIGNNWELILLDNPPTFLDGGEIGFGQKVTMQIKYPSYARENGYEGDAIIRYEITKNGSVENVSIFQDPGGGIGEETKRVVEIITQGTVFSQGTLTDAPVRVRKDFKLNFCLK